MTCILVDLRYSLGRLADASTQKAPNDFTTPQPPPPGLPPHRRSGPPLCRSGGELDCQSVCLSIFSLSLSINKSFKLFVYLYLCVSLYLTFCRCLSDCLSICILSLHLSVYIFINTSIYNILPIFVILSIICLSMVSICRSAYLSIYPASSWCLYLPGLLLP